MDVYRSGVHTNARAGRVHSDRYAGLLKPQADDTTIVQLIVRRGGVSVMRAYCCDMRHDTLGSLAHADQEARSLQA
jgi:hypothetical protein